MKDCLKRADQYDQHAFLPQLIGERLFEKLDLIKLQPQIILDLDTKTGTFLKKLKKRFPTSQIIGTDSNPAMLRQARKKKSWWQKQLLLQADVKFLPFKNQQIDLIFANCSSIFISLDQVLKEMQRILSPSGIILFSTLGVDTFKELHSACKLSGIDLFLPSYVDMHDIGDALLAHKLSDPVVEMEFLTIMYTSVEQLINELYGTGVLNFLPEKEQTEKLAKYYPCNAEGLYPMTLEVIYALAWGQLVKPEKSSGSAQQAYISPSQIKHADSKK